MFQSKGDLFVQTLLEKLRTLRGDGSDISALNLVLSDIAHETCNDEKLSELTGSLVDWSAILFDDSNSMDDLSPERLLRLMLLEQEIRQH